MHKLITTIKNKKMERIKRMKKIAKIRRMKKIKRTFNDIASGAAHALRN